MRGSVAVGHEARDPCQLEGGGALCVGTIGWLGPEAAATELVLSDVLSICWTPFPGIGNVSTYAMQRISEFRNYLRSG